jgi:hypothetical protein
MMSRALASASRAQSHSGYFASTLIIHSIHQHPSILFFRLFLPIRQIARLPFFLQFPIACIYILFPFLRPPAMLEKKTEKVVPLEMVPRAVRLMHVKKFLSNNKDKPSKTIETTQKLQTPRSSSRNGH